MKTRIAGGAPRLASRFGALAAMAAAAGLVSLGFAHSRNAASPQTAPSLVVHEWGTFTSIAGPDGRGVAWLPSGRSDLPGFVEHYRNADFKGGLRGLIRMETPVLYFHTPEELQVSVHISFPRGVITEWYPHASTVAPSDSQTLALFSPSQVTGRVSWDVHVRQDLLVPVRESAESRYYAARETSSNTVSVDSPAGEQAEKFLFYRGVAMFEPPLIARVGRSDRVDLQNSLSQTIPAVVLFERRGEKLGYRMIHPLTQGAALELPAATGTLASVAADFENLLLEQGLYRDEAHAMVETWRDSWFEEGSRLFYLVPREFVDLVVPASLDPQPREFTRVFVGRMELVTSATKEAVTRGLLSRNRQQLQSYMRFLEPIVACIAGTEAPQERARLEAELQWVYPNR